MHTKVSSAMNAKRRKTSEYEAIEEVYLESVNDRNKRLDVILRCFRMAPSKPNTGCKIMYYFAKRNFTVIDNAPDTIEYWCVSDKWQRDDYCAGNKVAWPVTKKEIPAGAEIKQVKQWKRTWSGMFVYPVA